MKKKTNRLIIDRVVLDDKQDFFDNISHSKNVLKTFMATYHESIEELDFERYCQVKSLFAIRLIDTNKLIGILVIAEENGIEAEIGYAIGEKYWGQGYGTEACGGFIDYLFKNKQYEIIKASFFKGNIASERVMQKCNMTHAYDVSNALTYLDESKDLTYYQIRREDYEK